MPLLRTWGSPLKLVAWAVVAMSCSRDTTEACPPLPCPLSLAVRLQLVSAATGLPVDSASVQVAGAVTGSAACSAGGCFVAGPAGDYQLTINAPGYQSAHLDVVVHGEPPKPCGCNLATAELRTVALVPSTAG